MKKKYWVFLALFVIALGADQLTKTWARGTLKPHCRVTTPLPMGCEPKPVIDGYWDYRYSENEGSAFGLFRGTPGARYLLFGIGIIALIVVFTFLRKAGEDQLRVAGELGLLAGGAVGNIVDRVLFGRVTDFIVWKVGTHEWPTFNVADAALVVGVLALLLDMKNSDAKDGENAAGAPAEKEKKAQSGSKKKRR